MGVSIEHAHPNPAVSVGTSFRRDHGLSLRFSLREAIYSRKVHIINYVHRDLRFKGIDICHTIVPKT
jgi:hypothetical protein